MDASVVAGGTPRRRDRWLLLVILLLVAAGLAWTLPGTYHVGADEGVYYRQGKALVDNGVGAGYADIARRYLSEPALQDYPNPLRIGTIAASALALSTGHGYRALSWLSLLALLTLLCVTWRFAVDFLDRRVALAGSVLLAASPLALGMARRALMDSLATTAAMLSLYAFFRLLDGRGRRPLAWFVAATTLAILVKETALLLLPCYTLLAAWFKHRGGLATSWRQLAAALLLPPLLALLLLLAAYGPVALHGIAEVVLGVMHTRIPYVVAYSSGPWYRYLIDYVTLSPWTFLLAVMWSGWLLLARRGGWMAVLLFVAGYLLCVYAPLTKNVRYLLLLDVPIRLFAAAMLMALLQGRHEAGTGAAREGSRAWLAVALLVPLVLVDLAAYHRYFVAGDIYDPVSYNLLKADHVVP